MHPHLHHVPTLGNPFTHNSFHSRINPSIHPTIYLSLCPITPFLSISFPTKHLPNHPPILPPPISLGLCPPIYLHAHPPIPPTIYSFIGLSTYPSPAHPSHNSPFTLSNSPLPSTPPSIHSPINQFTRPTIYPCLHAPTHQSLYLPNS